MVNMELQALQERIELKQSAISQREQILQVVARRVGRGVVSVQSSTSKGEFHE
jgi:outer membrane protein TolC